jgi:hypothetical protein
MKLIRTLAAAACAAAFTLASATAATAAPPGNDTAGGATAVTVLPTTITEDTTEATTDDLDAAVNADCGAPATNASVWFTYTDTTGAGFAVDMSASDYTGGFIVTAGDPADANLVACGPTSVAVSGGAPGTTYYVVAFSDTEVNGGNLSVTFSELPPAPETTLTVDPTGKAFKDGSARLTGTYSCTNASDFDSDIEGTLSQRVGRLKVNGFFFVYPLMCDGQVHTWEGVVTADNGTFSGGKAAHVTLIFACGFTDCTVQEVDGTVQLRRG